jgi:acetyltransferase-like isoleucine patch superfamily enzyme
MRQLKRQGLQVGRDCRIFKVTFSSEPWLISIGDRVTVASGVQILTHDGATWLIRDESGRRFRFQRVRIGNDVMIGANAVIMPGVWIQDRCVVGAGSVVTKSVPAGSIVAGVPAQRIANFDDYEARVLATFPTQARMKGNTWRERVTSIVDDNFAPFL